MANLERTYIVPLRREWLKAPKHKRAKKAVKALREFLSRHMKAELEDVKIGKWANQAIWARGIKKPMHKIKIKASKDEKGIIRAELFELSEKSKKIDAKEKELADKQKTEKEKKKEAAEKEKELEKKAEEKIKETSEDKEKKEEEKIMHKEVKLEENIHAPKEAHMKEKVKPFRQSMKK